MQTPRRGRPPLAPEHSDSRQKLIRVGLAHLTEKGYLTAGVDEILKSAGVPKGSFYHHFQSKAEFGSQLITAYDAYFIKKLERALNNETLGALDRLRAFAADAEAGMAKHGFRRGCLVGNLGQEGSGLPKGFREQLVTVLQGWQDRVAACFSLAQREGTLSSDADAEALARFFWIGWEGAVMRAKLELRPDPLHAFVSTFFSMITSYSNSKV